MACTVTLPVLSFDSSCPSVKPGQVYRLYHTRATSEDVLTDVEDAEEWETRLSDSDAIPGSGPAPIRTWIGIGSWGDAEFNQVDLPLGQVYNLPGNKALSFRCYDLSETNVAAAIAIRDAGTIVAKIWSEQSATILGSDTGIDGTMTADLVVPEGRADLSYIQINFTTKKSLGAMTDSPFTDPFI